jgi:YjbE family integral membrane protein
VAVLGTIAAIALRVLLTAGAALALGVPLLRVFGAGLLLAIAVRLLTEEPDQGDDGDGATSRPGIWKAIGTIIAADTVMSLDNVLAVAAAARGSMLLLGLGLLLSIPILVFGSTLIYKLLLRFPIIVWVGAAQLGWVAGATALSDPALQAWAQGRNLELDLVAPLAGAAYVLLHGLAARRFSRRRKS